MPCYGQSDRFRTTGHRFVVEAGQERSLITIRKILETARDRREDDAVLRGLRDVGVIGLIGHFPARHPRAATVSINGDAPADHRGPTEQVIGVGERDARTHGAGCRFLDRFVRVMGPNSAATQHRRQS